jgi:hypothetical protein
MKYQKGSFITVPNNAGLAGIHPAAQCLFMWLCFHANQEGQCFPSRRRLAELSGISVDMVDKMLKVLEEKHLILKTKRRKNETLNQTNIYEVLIGGVADTVGQVADTVGQGVADTVGSELNPVSLTQLTELHGELTPAQTANSFFVSLESQEKLVTAIAERYKINIDGVRQQISKFISYWTEPNKSGTKQRWQMEKTFEITRRLTVWFSRVKNYSRPSSNKGKTIIGLD